MIHLPERITPLVNKTLDHKVNCFCISELYFRETHLRHASADEMLNFVSDYFVQVEKSQPEALALIWSRTTLDLPLGKINVNELAKRTSGFPFGLVLEHSFVQLNQTEALHKPNPNLNSKVEILPLAQAIEPYLQLFGFEITWHFLINSGRFLL